MFFERYDKKHMESFAINVIAKSFDLKYATYVRPTDTDNFDYVSPDDLHAVEIVSVIPANELEAYKYEKQLAQGKKMPQSDRVINAIVREDGSLGGYYGGSLTAIIQSVKNAIIEKCTKARKRTNLQKYETIDLCICIVDGGLLDLYSFQNARFDFSESLFDNIFFITASCFIRYSKSSLYEEYSRKI